MRNTLRNAAGLIILILSVTAGSMASAADPITVETSRSTPSPAIWGNYVVWNGAENEVYAIDQKAKIPMPGLKIDGVPAIWENIVVWEGSNYYYDLNAQTLKPLGTYRDGVGTNPAISNGKIVWDNSFTYCDIEHGMVYAKDLLVGESPDIDNDRIVWSGSKGYYDIKKQKMIRLRGLDVGQDPAIHGQRITWSYLKGGYYDLELETYGHARIITGNHTDIFGKRLLWFGWDEPWTGPVAVWEHTCGTQRLGGLGDSNRAQIYGNTVVWDRDSGNKLFYISQAPSCCGDEDHPYPEGDLNHDCRVDFKDLALLTSHWLEDAGMQPGLKVTARLDKAVYSMEDTITLDITASNTSSEPMTIYSSSSWIYESYRIDGTFDPYSFEMALPAVRHMTIAPNESYTWTREIPIKDHYWYTFTPGRHSITGVLISYAESEMIEFEIVE